MKEVILSLVPVDSTPLLDILSVDTVNDMIVYFQGILAIFSHPQKDKNHRIHIFRDIYTPQSN